MGNVFRLRRPTPFTAMAFGRSPENSIGRSPAPKVFASNVFFLNARRGGFARKAGRRMVPALLARSGGRTRTGMGWRIALHSWRALEPQKSPKRNCDFLATPWLLFFRHGVTWVIINPGSPRGRSAKSPESSRVSRPGSSRGDRRKGRKSPAQVACGPAAPVRKAAVTWSATCTPLVHGPGGPFPPSCVSFACMGKRKRRRSQEQGITRAWRISRNN